MSKLSRRRAAEWAFWFVETGGNGSQASLKAGYRPAIAAKMATYLLHRDSVLQLVAAQIHRKAPGHESALRRLMLPSRAESVRRRLAELLCREPALTESYLQAKPPAGSSLESSISAETIPPTI